jgi:hypothetical protein
VNTTRWWLEGSGSTLALVSEYGDVASPTTPPDKPEHDWLSRHGVGINPPYTAIEWVETVTHARPPKPKGKRAKPKAKAVPSPAPPYQQLRLDGL